MITPVLLLALAANCLQGGDKKGEPQPPVNLKIPPSPPLSPAEALKAFRIAPGFRVELVASEPDVVAPVAMTFDPDGRMWVVEMRGFMPDIEGKGEDAPVGQVVVLEDADGDGKVDKRTVFLDRLVLPRAIALAGDGVLVAEPPGLWFCRDTTGDLVCDEKTLVTATYTGRGNPEHIANGLLRAIDNWIYSANTSRRFRRDGGKWLEGTTRSRGQWGITQDNEGRLFYNSNPELLRGDLLSCWSPQAHSTKGPGVGILITKDQTIWPARMNPGVNRGYQPGFLREDGTLTRVTAACAPTIYRGDHYPFEFRGNAFICDPGANLVSRKILVYEDAAILSRDAYDKAEFLASTDERFRPVWLTPGPDGCLYVVDFHRGIIQHRAYITTFLRQQILSRGLEKPLDRGRIYRLVSESKPPGRAPRLAKAPSAELVGHLSHPNGWWRDTAQRLLVERRDPAAAPALRKLALEPGDRIPRLHAIFTLEGMGQLDPATLAALAVDKDPRIPSAAAAAKENGNPIDALVAARELPAEAALAGKEIDFIEKVMSSEVWQSEQADRARLLQKLAARVAADAKPDRVAELLDLIGAQAVAARWRQKALLEGLLEGRPRKTVALAARSVALVKLSFAEDETVRRQAQAVGGWVTWPDRPAKEPEPPRSEPLTSEEKTRWERGKKQFAVSCAACHSISGLGEDGKGPPLVDSAWVQGSPERLARIVLNGLTGPITVEGTVYSNVEMPAVLNMTNDEIAEVLTYIRREWGHQAGAVDSADVKKIRAAVEDRDDPWTERELLKFP